MFTGLLLFIVGGEGLTKKKKTGLANHSNSNSTYLLNEMWWDLFTTVGLQSSKHGGTKRLGQLICPDN